MANVSYERSAAEKVWGLTATEIQRQIRMQDEEIMRRMMCDPLDDVRKALTRQAVDRGIALTKAPTAAKLAAPTLTPADIQHAANEGRNTERDRILARLNAIKPGEEPYSRIQSEWERRGAMRMWERLREAIIDGKEAHKDKDAA